MSSVPTQSFPPRKSFAQVAAAAHVVPPNLKPKESKQPSQRTTDNQPPKIQSSVPTEPPVISPVLPAAPLTNNNVKQDTLSVGGKENVPQLEPKILNGTNFRSQLVVDNGTSASAVDVLIRRDTSDTKSVASRTTLTLDEKESLRPDDSASVQAGIEDDRPSPSGSRLGTTNSEARAFSDQLHEIERSEPPRPLAQRGMPVIAFPLPRHPSSGVVYTGATAAAAAAAAAAASYQPPVPLDPGQFRIPQNGMVLPPDEKLMEALASPKDRLFVLKVEQDIIDFVKDSKDQVLVLPQTNSFYRMLSHKLADYYCLDHSVDDSMSSVRISRTIHCRLPISLLSMSTNMDGPTPPPNAPTRKIMRRNDGVTSGFTTENPSKTTSEAGVMSGSDEGKDTPAKDKSQMTREERETRYHEVRARIFKDWKEENGAGSEDSNQATEDPSRASSPSRAAKKPTKKKKPKDDGFEPRSNFNILPNQPYVSNGNNQQQISSNAMFNGFQNMNISNPYPNPQQMMNPGAMQNRDQAILQQQYMQQQQQQWHQMQQQQQQQQQQQMSPNYGMNQFQSTQTSYMQNDGTQAGMYHPYSSYSSGMNASQTTPKPGHASPSGYPPSYQNGQQSWPQMGYGPSFAPQGMPYQDQTGAPHAQMFGGYPQQPQGPQNGMPFYDQQMWHAYNNQQFNPMSQAFVPSMNQNTSNGARYPSAGNMQRQQSNVSQLSGFSSPKHQTRNNPQSPRGKDSPSMTSSKQVIPAQQSSISKWANTTSLPSKPPPPAKPDKVAVPPNPMTNMHHMS